MHIKGKLTPAHLETQRPIKKILDGIVYESVLDIGCSAQQLKHVLKPKKYFGVDMVDSTFGVVPDLKLDLKNVKKIPLRSKSYDVVVASQVLEHIPEISRLCKELMRIAKKYIVIGLPNELVYDSRIGFSLGKTSFKSYQLIEEPWEIHYWFFSKFTADELIRREFSNRGWKVKRFFGDFHSRGARLLPYSFKDILANKWPQMFAKGLYYLIEHPSK